MGLCMARYVFMRGVAPRSSEACTWHLHIVNNEMLHISDMSLVPLNAFEILFTYT